MSSPTITDLNAAVTTGDPRHAQDQCGGIANSHYYDKRGRLDRVTPAGNSAALALHLAGKGTLAMSNSVVGGQDGENKNPSVLPKDSSHSAMGRAGIEPATHGFTVHCSTN